MKIFLCHATEDKPTAESIAFSLRSRGHKVFLDRDDLPTGKSFDQRIQHAVNRSDAFVFLISPVSVAERHYTLTELAFARRKWPDPSGRVLPVMARKTPLKQVPPYLKAVTILDPVGNIAAETSAAVDEMRRHQNPWLVAATAVFAACVLAAIVMLWFPVPGGRKTEELTKLAVSDDGSRASTERLHRLIAQMYSDLQTDRTDAYGAIMAEFKNSQKEIVSALLSYAVAVKDSQPNANGLYNTAVMLKNLNLEATQPHKADINQFCDQAEKVGDRTKRECDALRAWIQK
jgi:hypothetical protein